MIAVFFTVIALTPAVAAESAPSQTAAPLGNLETGIRAFAAGKYELAIKSLDAALQTKLASDRMASALFYRGLAYRKIGRPGQAIVDLTRALQQSNGLSGTDRSDAEEIRIAASREAGLSEAELVVVPSQPEKTGHDTDTAPDVRPDPNSVTTGSAWSAAIAEPVRSNAGAEPAAVAAPIAFVTEVKATQLPPVAAGPVASAPVGPAPVASAPVPAADVRLQLGDVSSRSEAFALSVRLTSQYGSAFAPRKLEITEKVVENQGTVYRLRLGPYANPDEPQQLCNSLRSNGFACSIE
jgi:tetratricopeptide (TPR) repeat protein